jgi:hypothetical protein
VTYRIHHPVQPGANVLVPSGVLAGTELVNCPEYVRSWIAAENESH